MTSTRPLAAVFVGALLALVAVVTGPGAMAADVHPLAIGSPAPDFNLPGIDGKHHKLADYADAKVLVIVFTCNHCPTAQAYEDRIKHLASDYQSRGVQVVAINPNSPKGLRLNELGYTEYGDSFAEMKLRAAEHHFNFPYLYDGETQSVAHAYGCLATPHVFIFDADRKLRYEGHIDDNDNPAKVEHHDAVNAIEAILDGKEVPVKKTRVFGCSTKWITKGNAVEQATEKWNARPVSLNVIDAAAVKKLAANDTKNWRLVNVWATWCGPCVAELPDLVEISRMYSTRPFEFVTISVDKPDHKDQALQRLKDDHVPTTNYLFDGTPDQLADALDPKWPGPVPYTILIAPGGKIVYQHVGQIDPITLKKEIVKHFGRTYF